MPINTLATATLFQNKLDKVAIQEAVTGWMDANAGAGYLRRRGRSQNSKDVCSGSRRL